jgi:hypothetical protein
VCGCGWYLKSGWLERVPKWLSTSIPGLRDAICKCGAARAAESPRPWARPLFLLTRATPETTHSSPLFVRRRCSSRRERSNNCDEARAKSPLQQPEPVRRRRLVFFLH